MFATQLHLIINVATVRLNSISTIGIAVMPSISEENSAKNKIMYKEATKQLHFTNLRKKISHSHVTSPSGFLLFPVEREPYFISQLLDTPNIELVSEKWKK